jgi:hypothetical protein
MFEIGRSMLEIGNCIFEIDCPMFEMGNCMFEIDPLIAM